MGEGEGWLLCTTVEEGDEDQTERIVLGPEVLVLMGSGKEGMSSGSESMGVIVSACAVAGNVGSMVGLTLSSEGRFWPGEGGEDRKGRDGMCFFWGVLG